MIGQIIISSLKSLPKIILSQKFYSETQTKLYHFIIICFVKALQIVIFVKILLFYDMECKKMFELFVWMMYQACNKCTFKHKICIRFLFLPNIKDDPFHVVYSLSSLTKTNAQIMQCLMTFFQKHFTSHKKFIYTKVTSISQ